MMVRADKDILRDIIGVLLIAEQTRRIGVNRGTVLAKDLREKRLGSGAVRRGAARAAFALAHSTDCLARAHGSNRAQRGLDDVKALLVRRGPLHGKPF